MRLLLWFVLVVKDDKRDSGVYWGMYCSGGSSSDHVIRSRWSWAHYQCSTERWRAVTSTTSFVSITHLWNGSALFSHFLFTHFSQSPPLQSFLISLSNSSSFIYPLSLPPLLYLCLSDRHEVNVIYENKAVTSPWAQYHPTLLCVRVHVCICRCVHVSADIHKHILPTEVQCGCGQQKLLPLESL